MTAARTGACWLAREGSWHLAVLPVLLVFGRRDVTERAVQPAVIEPGHPPGGGRLEAGEGLPRAAPVDQLGLVQADDRLGQGVVVGIPGGPGRGDRAGLGQPGGVADGQVLPAVIGIKPKSA